MTMMTIEPAGKATCVYVELRRIRNNTGNGPVTVGTWPSSTPTLKAKSATSLPPDGNPRSLRTLAKPKPCISPNTNAAIHTRRDTTGKRLLIAATATEVAMTHSTRRDGNSTIPEAAADKVIEWARVKAVTTRVVAQTAPPRDSTGRHTLPDLSTTAGSRSVTRNSMWS